MLPRRTLSMLVLLALMTSTLACNLSSFVMELDETAVAEGLDRTLAARTVDVPHEPSPSETPSPTPAETAPMVSVSVNTNCRSGPGSDYEIVGGLLVGEQAEIVLLSSIPNFVIIELPDGSGQTCWLWMQYGTQEGSTEGLAIATPPPTPTGGAPPGASYSFNASFDNVVLCDENRYVTYHVTNTGGGPFQSYRLSVRDRTEGITLGIQGINFVSTASCFGAIYFSTLEAGGSGYVAIPFDYDPTGHNLEATILLCSGEAYDGTCTSQTVASVP